MLDPSVTSLLAWTPRAGFVRMPCTTEKMVVFPPITKRNQHDRGACDAGGTLEASQGIARVAPQPVEPGTRAGLPDSLLDLIDAAELDAGLPPCILLGHPAGDQIANMLIEMELQLFVQVVIQALAAEPGIDAGHSIYSAVFSTSAMAFASRSQSDRSRSSCFWPALVRA